MMNKNRFFLGLLSLALLVGITSCEKDDEKDEQKPQNEAKTLEIDAKDYSKWVYVSFETGEIVGTSAFAETKDDLSWDIAFHRYDIRLNGGKSGKGEGAALLLKDKIGKTGWDAVMEAPESGYVADGMIPMVEEYKGMPPKITVTNGNEVITGGMEVLKTTGSWVNASGMPPTYNVTNQIFVVKTAKGKYVKLWFKSYVGSDKHGGYITLKYLLQKDGSRKFN